MILCPHCGAHLLSISPTFMSLSVQASPPGSNRRRSSLINRRVSLMATSSVLVELEKAEDRDVVLIKIAYHRMEKTLQIFHYALISAAGGRGHDRDWRVRSRELLLAMPSGNVSAIEGRVTARACCQTVSSVATDSSSYAPKCTGFLCKVRCFICSYRWSS